MTKTAKIEKSETRNFDAEVGKILQLMIHALYTNKDIFLRELISNASDACDKLRYQALTDASLMEGDQKLAIHIRFDPKASTITLSDNGIGMSKEELASNLGTIARSGTQEFLKTLSGDAKKDTQLIGQFGVGFYASFMVADRVQVISRRAGENKAHLWESDGQGTYVISDMQAAQRGTQIVLHIREDAKEYLDKHRLKHIIKTYSDHVAFPISLSDGESTEEVNQGAALWLKSKSEVSEQQYKEFFTHVAHMPGEPWLTLHNKNEGTLEFTNLLFIPQKRPFDLYHPERARRVKLYVKRVFITDKDIDIVPQWLRFLRGVVDSEDLPLNISRETLQHNPILTKIRKAVTKRVLTELKKKAENDPKSYEIFWQEFGGAVKEGLCDTLEDKEAIIEICRFHSTHGEELTSLDTYIARMPKEQEDIYYLTGDSLEELRKHPLLEGFTTRGVEVLLLSDHVDDFWTVVFPEYKEKNLKSITRSGIDLSKISSNPTEKTAQSENLDGLVNYIKQILGEQVADVRITTKLASTPVCLAAYEKGMDFRMERFLAEQMQIQGKSAKILEINPEHGVIKSLAKRITEEKTDDKTADIVHLLYAQAALFEGEQPADIKGFSSRLSALIARDL